MFSTQRQEVYIENECQNIRRGIRDIRDITGMPASDWQNTQEYKENESQNGHGVIRSIGVCFLHRGYKY